jgi:hypothetical protein
MDPNSFLAKVSAEYPSLLVAEIIVLATIAGVGILIRRYFLPLGQRYRRRAYGSLKSRLERIDSFTTEERKRVAAMIDHGFKMLLSLGVCAITILVTLLFIAKPPSISLYQK